MLPALETLPAELVLRIVAYLPLQALGYEVAHSGDGRWNGTAVLSRVGLSHVSLELEGHPEPRLTSAQCGPLHVTSVYVPNGRALADDVTDTLLTVACGKPAAGGGLTPIGDGVAANDKPFGTTFPYLASPHSGNP